MQTPTPTTTFTLVFNVATRLAVAKWAILMLMVSAAIALFLQHFLEGYSKLLQALVYLCIGAAVYLFLEVAYRSLIRLLRWLWPEHLDLMDPFDTENPSSQQHHSHVRDPPKYNEEHFVLLRVMSGQLEEVKQLMQGVIRTSSTSTGGGGGVGTGSTKAKAKQTGKARNTLPAPQG